MFPLNFNVLNFNSTFAILYRPLFRENESGNFTYIYRIIAINNLNTENTFLHVQTRSQPWGGPITIAFFARLFVCLYVQRFTYSPEYTYSLSINSTAHRIRGLYEAFLQNQFNVKYGSRRSDAVFTSIWCNTLFFPGTKSVKQSIL